MTSTITIPTPGTSTAQDLRNVRTASGLVPGALWWAQAQCAATTEFMFHTSYEYRLAKDPHCPAAILDILADDQENLAHERVQIAVAENPSTALPTLERLATNKYLNVQEAVASRAGLNEQTYRKLAAASGTRILHAVCTNPALPVGVATSLYAKGQGRDFLVRNPVLPTDLLAAAAFDPALAPLVAGNPNTPASVLEYLYELPHQQAVSGLARNQNVRAGILTDLYRRDSELREYILGNPACPVELFDEVMDWTRGTWITDMPIGYSQALASNPSLPARLATSLWEMQPAVRYLLAQNAWCPADVFDLAHICNGGRVQLGFAENPALTSDMLDDLAFSQRSVDVRHRALRHPNVSAVTLRQARLFDLVDVEGIRSDRIEDLEDGAAARAIALAGGWNGTLGELIDTAKMLGA